MPNMTLANKKKGNFGQRLFLQLANKKWICKMVSKILISNEKITKQLKINIRSLIKNTTFNIVDLLIFLKNLVTLPL